MNIAQALGIVLNRSRDMIEDSTMPTTIQAHEMVVDLTTALTTAHVHSGALRLSMSGWSMMPATITTKPAGVPPLKHVDLLRMLTSVRTAQRHLNDMRADMVKLIDAQRDQEYHDQLVVSVIEARAAAMDALTKLLAQIKDEEEQNPA